MTLAKTILREQQKSRLSIMRKSISFLTMLVLVSSLVAGCGCLTADAYDKPACQKYDTHWPRPNFDED